jgi:LysR family transcriptional regulator, low CO2-responsive transcriptional regulator
MKNITLRQIKIFLSAATCLNFTKAAKELHITSPAVSLQIKEMENDIGVKLFDRNNKKISLTSAGEYFLVYAKRIASTLHEAELIMGKLQGTEFTTLKIGLVSTAQHFLPQLLSAFKAEYPTVQIKIEVRNRQQLIQLLKEGDIDVAIMGRPPKEINNDLAPIAIHPHGFVASPQHPLALEANVNASTLNTCELISREQGSGTRFIMEKFLSEHNISPLISMEMSSNETIKLAVTANLGISFMSLHTVAEEIRTKKITVLDIEDTPVIRAWHLVSLNNRLTSSMATNFQTFMQNRGGEIISNFV